MGAGAVALSDLFGSVRALPLAFTLAVSDINGKYKRTVLGPLWIVLGQAVTIAAFVVVFAGLFGQDMHAYALYLAAGFPVWMLISSYLTDMSGAFIQARGFIESFELPWLLHIWRRSISYVLVFFHQISTLFVVMAIVWWLRHDPTVLPRWEMLWVFPALAIVMIGGSGVGMLAAVFGARYRDLQPAMIVISGFLYLCTPVMWRAEQLHANAWVVAYNPLYYIVTLVREPLLGRVPDLSIWIAATAVAAALLLIGFLSFWLSRRRLYHWL